MPAYDLTPEAKQDIRGVWLYTAERWGEPQADRYTGLLEACFRRIAGKRARSKVFSERYPQAQVARCEHHYVFFLRPEGQKPVIFAVLYERMDMLARIGARLTT